MIIANLSIARNAKRRKNNEKSEKAVFVCIKKFCQYVADCSRKKEQFFVKGEESTIV